MNLQGKKYHSKRNHIAAFDRENNWSFELINKENLSDCIAMNKAWLSENKEKILSLFYWNKKR
jgi:hypothetical protein